MWLNSNSVSPALFTRPGNTDSHRKLSDLGLCCAEIVFCGFLPAGILLIRAATKGGLDFTAAAALVCGGVLLNRFVLTVQTLAYPTLPFDEFVSYLPSWQEFAVIWGG